MHGTTYLYTALCQAKMDFLGKVDAQCSERDLVQHPVPKPDKNRQRILVLVSDGNIQSDDLALRIAMELRIEGIQINTIDYNAGTIPSPKEDPEWGNQYAFHHLQCLAGLPYSDPRIGGCTFSGGTVGRYCSAKNRATQAKDLGNCLIDTGIGPAPTTRPLTLIR